MQISLIKGELKRRYESSLPPPSLSFIGGNLHLFPPLSIQQCCRFRKCSVAHDREKCFSAFYARVQRELGRASASASFRAECEERETRRQKSPSSLFLSLSLARPFIIFFFSQRRVRYYLFAFSHAVRRSHLPCAIYVSCASLFPNSFPILSPRRSFFPVFAKKSFFPLIFTRFFRLFHSMRTFFSPRINRGIVST